MIPGDQTRASWVTENTASCARTQVKTFFFNENFNRLLDLIIFLD